MIEDNISLLVEEVRKISENMAIVQQDVKEIKEYQHPKEDYSVQETAKALACSDSKVHKLYRAGKLKGFQEGGKGHKLFISKASVQALIEGKK